MVDRLYAAELLVRKPHLAVVDRDLSPRGIDEQLADAPRPPGTAVR
jgi:hypothetical protein